LSATHFPPHAFCPDVQFGPESVPPSAPVPELVVLVLVPPVPVPPVPVVLVPVLAPVPWVPATEWDEPLEPQPVQPANSAVNASARNVIAGV
jgi:hypothetical protein